jgi:hypothetical protein
MQPAEPHVALRLLSAQIVSVSTMDVANS